MLTADDRRLLTDAADTLDDADAAIRDATALGCDPKAMAAGIRAIVDRPAPTPAAAAGVDLDAVEEAEHKMTPGPWPIMDPNDREPGPPVWHGSNFGGVTAIGPIHYDSDEDETQPGSPAHLRAEDDSRGIIALRNAAPALIAELRAARAEIAALRAKVDEVRELISDTEHESTCTIGPYGPGQSSADCNCLVGTIAAALEAL